MGTPGLRRTKAGLTLGHGNRAVIFRAGDLDAASSGQSGTSLIYPVNNVGSGNGTKSVVLPTPVAGKVVFVYHSVATVGLPVYPPSGCTINGGSTNAAVTIEGKTLAMFVGSSATNWSAIYTANT